MVTRDPDASFDTPNVVIGRQGRNELTLSFRPAPYLARLLGSLYRASTEVVLRNGTTTPTEALIWVPVQRRR